MANFNDFMSRMRGGRPGGFSGGMPQRGGMPPLPSPMGQPAPAQMPFGGMQRPGGPVSRLPMPSAGVAPQGMPPGMNPDFMAKIQQQLTAQQGGGMGQPAMQYAPPLAGGAPMQGGMVGLGSYNPNFDPNVMGGMPLDKGGMSQLPLDQQAARAADIQRQYMAQQQLQQGGIPPPGTGAPNMMGSPLPAGALNGLQAQPPVGGAPQSTMAGQAAAPVMGGLGQVAAMSSPTAPVKGAALPAQ